MTTNFTKKLACLATAVLTAAGLASTARADYISAVQALGPVGWWRLSDSTATNPLFIVTNAGTLGKAGNGYVVQTGADTPNLGIPGLIGNCVQFNNPGNTVGNCDSKIEVPYQSSLCPKPPFSIEFWANPTGGLGADSTGFSPLENFNPTGNEGGSRRGWLFYLNSAGTWNFRLGAYSGYAVNLVGNGGNAVPGTWQHIAVTWDGTNVIMYANGVKIGSAVSNIHSDGWVPNGVSFLRMGGSPLTGNNAEYNAISGTTTIGNRGYAGLLQHVALYSKALSAATVNAHYAAASTNNAGYTQQVQADGPVGYWPLADSAVPTPPTSTIADSGVDGTATGTVHPGVKVRSGPGYAGFGGDTNGLFVDGVNGYIQVSDTPDLSSNITSTISLAAWVKPEAEDYFRDIIARGFNTDEAETFLRISRGPLFTGDFEYYGADPSGDDVEYYEAGTTDGGNFYDSAQFIVPAGDIGNWVFLVATCDGAYWNLYRNGVLAASVPFDSDGVDTGPVLPAQEWTIGSRAPDSTTPGTYDTAFSGQTESFDGTIFEPAIFSQALTPADVANLYSAALVPPVLTVTPQNPGAVFAGSSLTLTALAEGAPTISYLWTSNGVATADTTTNFTISSIAAGTYTIGVQASNAYGTNTASVTFTVTTAPPGITVAPLAEERYVGYPFTLSVGASGSTPLTYTWMDGSTVVESGSSSNYTATASLSDAGSYTVIVANAAGSVTSAPVSVIVKSVPSGYPATVVGDSPISYWRLDETNGTTAFDMISGNNGIYNSASLGQPGYSPVDPDTAVAFSGLNSYIANISGTAINFINNAPFTLEAWANGPSGMADQSTIIAKGIGNNGTTETEQFALDVSGGDYRFFTTHAGNKYEALGTVGPNGTWQHVVGVYDTSTTQPTLRLYVNGVQVATATATYAQSTTVTPVTIGSKRTGNDPNYDGTFDGTIDEVAVYNTALSPSQVLAHYNGAYGTTLAPVLTVQPTSVTNYVGLPVTLSVGAYGSYPLNYQWYQGSTPISGANASTYSVPNVGASDAGSYSVNISNGVGSTNSATVAIVVLSPPTNSPSISDLVMHLPFNGSLTDATGRGNNGTGEHASVTGITPLAPSAATAPDFYYTDGPFGTNLALHYSTVATNSGGLTANGTSYGTNDYYVTLGIRPDLQFGTNSFTVSYWIRLPVGFGENAPYGGDLPFFTDVVGSTGGWGYCFTMAYGYGTADPVPSPDPLDNEVGAWGTSIYDSAGNGVRYYGDNYNAINDGYYHNMVQVVDRVANKLTVYIDGAPAIEYLDAGTTINAGGTLNNGEPAVIGQDPTGYYGEDGSGDIADLGVWTKALTPLEAASIYEAGSANALTFTGTPPPPSIPGTITINKVVAGASSVTLSWSALPAGPAYTFSVLSATNLVSGGWVTNSTGISTTNYTDSVVTPAQKFYRVTSP